MSDIHFWNKNEPYGYLNPSYKAQFTDGEKTYNNILEYLKSNIDALANNEVIEEALYDIINEGLWFQFTQNPSLEKSLDSTQNRHIIADFSNELLGGDNNLYGTIISDIRTELRTNLDTIMKCF